MLEWGKMLKEREKKRERKKERKNERKKEENGTTRVTFHF